MSALTDKIAKVIGEKIFTANIDKNDLSELIKEIAVIAEAGGGGLVIPLSGTTVGNPVTGNIELNEVTKIYFNNTDYYRAINFSFKDEGINISSTNNISGYTSFIQISPEHILIYSNNETSKGLSSNVDFTQNITDLDYTQKIYVDGLRGKHISKTTTEINAIVTPQAGETYFNTTLNKLCFFNGTIWQQVTSSAM